MSFEFNESLLNDVAFNDKLKEQLTVLLTNSLVRYSLNNQQDYISLNNNITLNTDINNNTSVVLQSNAEKIAYSGPTATNNNDGFNKKPLLTIAKTKRTNKTTNTSTLTVKDTANGSKIGFIKNQVKINVVNFPMTPQIEILDIDITTQPRSLIKAIGKVTCQRANVEMETNVESNLLMLSLQQTPNFTKPKLIINDSLLIPVTLNFKNINLELITNLFMRNYGMSMSFNDVLFDFDFDCSIKILQNTIEEKLKFTIISFFKDLLPQAIFNKSKNWFNQNDNKDASRQTDLKSKQSLNHDHLVTFDESDFQDFSLKNLTRLSNIYSSRQTLSFHGTKKFNNLAIINNCLERQNLHRFISRIPNLQNAFNLDSNNRFYSKHTDNIRNDENLLPKEVLDNNLYDLDSILSIQEKLFQRSNNFKIKKSNNKVGNDENVIDNDNYKPKRRVIKLFKNKPTKTVDDAPQNLGNPSTEQRETKNVSTEKISPLLNHKDDLDNVSPRTSRSTTQIEIKHVSPRKLNKINQYKMEEIVKIDNKLIENDDFMNSKHIDNNHTFAYNLMDRKDLIRNMPMRRISSPSLRSLNNHSIANQLNPINFVGLSQSTWGQVGRFNNHSNNKVNTDNSDTVATNLKSNIANSPPNSPPPYSVDKM